MPMMPPVRRGEERDFRPAPRPSWSLGLLVRGGCRRARSRWIRLPARGSCRPRSRRGAGRERSLPVGADSVLSGAADPGCRLRQQRLRASSAVRGGSLYRVRRGRVPVVRFRPARSSTSSGRRSRSTSGTRTSREGASSEATTRRTCWAFSTAPRSRSAASIRRACSTSPPRRTAPVIQTTLDGSLKMEVGRRLELLPLRQRAVRPAALRKLG